MRFGTSRKGGNLLVAYMHPLNLGLPANGIGQAVEAVTDDSVNSLDAGGGKNFRKLVRNCFHASHHILRKAGADVAKICENALRANRPGDHLPEFFGLRLIPRFRSDQFARTSEFPRRDFP